jgi:hypothetical protein
MYDTAQHLKSRKRLHYPSYLRQVPESRDSRYWLQLEEVGVTVIPVLSEEMRAAVLREVVQSVRQSPELKEHVAPPTPLLVSLGGFGALGTASSYHFPIIRKLRGELLRSAGAQLFSHQRLNVEVLPDRLCLRLNGQKPGAEMWHRDITEFLPENVADSVRGGWLNLSPFTQYFSCVVNTHREDRRQPFTRVGDTALYYTIEGRKRVEHTGIVVEVSPNSVWVSTQERVVPIRQMVRRRGNDVTYEHDGHEVTSPFIEELSSRASLLVSVAAVEVPADRMLEVEHLDESLEGVPDEAAAEGFARMKRRRIPKLEQQKVRVAIPPGHYGIFNQLTIHEVLATPAAGDEDAPYAKLFMGFRLTFDDRPVVPGLRQVFEEQALPRLFSGQEIYNYSANHYGQVESGMYLNTNYPLEHGLATWSTRFIDEIPRIPVNTKAGNTYQVVVRKFPSLTEIKRRFYDYTEGELEVAAGGPRRKWSSVWGLWDGQHWSQRPFSLDRVSARKTRRSPVLLDPAGPGPSDLSAYAWPKPAPEVVDLTRRSPPMVDLSGDSDEE